MLSLLYVGTATAQSGTNSPYSQFGLGELSDPTSGFNRGMNGLGIGFRENTQVNFKNPASYSAIDSLSFLFDVGMSGQITNFKQGNVSKNAKNADFEYAVAGLRLLPRLGMSFGIIPYTNIGYNYATSHAVGDTYGTSQTITANGSGGLHQIYLGMGWMPVRGFSIGINAAYLYGKYTKTLTNAYSDSYANTLTMTESADIRTAIASVGAQFTTRLKGKNSLTIGATFNPGFNIGGKPHLDLISYNTQTAVADTSAYPGKGEYQLKLPMEIGAGLAFVHDERTKIGLDYQWQRWSAVQHPVYVSGATADGTYVMSNNYYQDRHKVTLGGVYSPSLRGRSIMKRIQYRAGLSYATPYYNIQGENGPREIGASIGIGLPIVNGYTNRSMLNISVQYVNRQAAGFITENTIKLNIGLTFNERWFAKWKLE